MFLQTAYTTQWALFLLSSNEQSKIRAQLDGSNFETPLIRGTVKESLRLFPVATFIGRILPMDGIIGNYRIPKHVKFICQLLCKRIKHCLTDRCHCINVLNWKRRNKLPES